MTSRSPGVCDQAFGPSSSKVGGVQNRRMGVGGNTNMVFSVLDCCVRLQRADELALEL